MSRGPTILLVDDDPEILEMTALLLRGAGYGVRTAVDGEDAYVEARLEPPALVLLDINMPGTGGWETLRLLKADDATQPVPVIMFSVNYELREKLHALQQGAVDYVTKPFDTESLLRRVGEIVGAPEGGQP